MDNVSRTSRLAAGPTRALVATRALLEESEHATFAAQFRREIETQAEIRKSEDALEGRQAFVEKRAAGSAGGSVLCSASPSPVFAFALLELRRTRF